MLKKIQKIINLDLHFFVKGGFYTAIQQGIAILTGIAITLVFSRYTSKHLFGQYNFIIAFLKIGIIFSLSGVHTAVTLATIKGYKKALLQTPRIRMQSSLIGSIVLFASGLYYLFQHQPLVGQSLLVLALFFPLLYSFNAYPSFLRAERKFKKSALFSAVTLLFNAILIISALMLTKNIILISLAYLVGYALPHFYFFQKTKKLIPFKGKKDPDFKKFSVFITLTKALSFLSLHLDKIILGALLGYKQLAVYTIAQIPSWELNRNLQSFINIPTLKIIPKKKEQAVKEIKKHSGKLLLIGLSLASAGWFLTPLFIKTLYTSKYSGSIQYARILMGTVILSPINLLLQNVIIFQKQKKQTVFLSFYPALPKIILYLILIPKFGILGAVVTSILEPILLSSYFICLNFKINAQNN